MAKTYRIQGLDGLRAIAVTLVVLHHKTALNAYDVGSYGVWLFFVLSGFLIISILHEERLKIERGEATVRQALRVFMTRRALRIFPIYYLVLLVTLPIFLTGHADSGAPLAPWEALMNFLYLSNIWIGQVRGEWVGAFSLLWSLSIEEQFYLIGAALLLGVTARRSLPVCAAIVVIGLAAKLGLHLAGRSAIAIYTSSLVNFAMIAFGGLCILSLGAAKPAAGRNPWLSPLLLAAYLALPVVIAVFGIPNEKRLISQLAFLLVGPLLLSIFFNQGQWLVRVLEWRPIRSLGKVSYGVYLYHNFSDYGVRALAKLISFVRADFAFAGWQALVLSVTGTLVVAGLSWRYIEKPLLKLRPASLGGPQAQAAPSAVVGDGGRVPG